MNRLPAALALALLMAVAGCAQAKVTERVVVDRLVVTFTVVRTSMTDIRWFVARAIVRNRGSAPVQLFSRSLATASLAVEYRGPDGRPGPHCPPPMPSADDSTDHDRIEPHRRIGFSYDAGICMRLHPGYYQVRLRYENNDASRGDWVGGFTTGWVPFELR